MFLPRPLHVGGKLIRSFIFIAHGTTCQYADAYCVFQIDALFCPCLSVCRLSLNESNQSSWGFPRLRSSFMMRVRRVFLYKYHEQRLTSFLNIFQLGLLKRIWYHPLNSHLRSDTYLTIYLERFPFCNSWHIGACQILGNVMSLLLFLIYFNLMLSS